MTAPDTAALDDRVESPIGGGDRLAVVGYGAVTWPWLLRSLYGGRARDKAALLARLDLPAEALPKLGSWRADIRFLTRLVDLIEAQRPATVVELGGGATSLVIAAALARYGGRLVCYEQFAQFADETRAMLHQHGLDGTIIHAPLADAPGDWPGRWYALSDVPPAIDLLVVDGPPWTLHPRVRGAAETLFGRIAPGGIVLLDDAARPGERLIARAWRKRWPQFAWRYEPLIKGLLTGVRRA